MYEAQGKRALLNERIAFGLYQSCANRGNYGHVSVFGCGGVGGEWVGGLDQRLDGWVVLCLCELCVRIICIYGRSRYLYIVLGRYLHILSAHNVQS